jgi:hypothetical protein
MHLVISLVMKRPCTESHKQTSPRSLQQVLAASLMLIAALTSLSSCATSRSEQQVYENRTYKPEGKAPVVAFSYGGAWSPLYRYTVNGTQACREIYRPKKDPKTHITRNLITQQQEATPTPEQWQAFWSRVEPLRLAEWRKTYNSKDIGAHIYDGTQWHLRYTTEEGEITSSGDNGYPVMRRPKAATLDTKSFDELTSAFDLLFPTPMRQFAASP